MSCPENVRNAGKTALSEPSAAQVKAVESPLSAIQAATASLPEPIRAAILALVAAVQPAELVRKPAHNTTVIINLDRLPGIGLDSPDTYREGSPMFRFTIRELVLLTLVVAMGVGWWLERAKARQLESQVWFLSRAIEFEGYRAVGGNLGPYLVKRDELRPTASPLP